MDHASNYKGEIWPDKQYCALQMSIGRRISVAVILSGGDGKGKGGGEKGERQMERCGRLQYNISSSGGDTHILSTHSSYHTWQEKKRKMQLNCIAVHLKGCCLLLRVHACVCFLPKREGVVRAVGLTVPHQVATLFTQCKQRLCFRTWQRAVVPSEQTHKDMTRHEGKKAKTNKQKKGSVLHLWEQMLTCVIKIYCKIDPGTCSSSLWYNVDPRVKFFLLSSFFFLLLQKM